MAEVKFKYGDESVIIDLPDKNVLGIIGRKKDKSREARRPIREMVKNALYKPEETSRLRQTLKKNRPGYLVIIVSDISRNISNYSAILDLLVEEIIESGVREENIEFIVALGTHPVHTAEEHKRLYSFLPDKFKFSFHDCHNNLKNIGKTSTGLDMLINERVMAADTVITTGKINYHYLAGFSGGRKSILPGVAGHETIRENHIKLVRNGIGIGRLEGNVINQEMEEASQMVGVDFALNIIEDHNQDTIWAKAGQAEAVFRIGTEFFLREFSFDIKQKADCIFVAAGRDDKDFFAAHKIINLAAGFVKPHGSIVLIAQAPDGPGNERFNDYLVNFSLDDLINYPANKIELGGHRAFVTARLLKDYRIYVHSSIGADILRRLHFVPVHDPASLVTELKKDYGNDFKAYLNPDGLKYRARLTAKSN